MRALSRRQGSRACGFHLTHSSSVRTFRGSKAAPGHLGSDDTSVTIWSSCEQRDSDHKVGIRASGAEKGKDSLSSLHTEQELGLTLLFTQSIVHTSQCWGI